MTSKLEAIGPDSRAKYVTPLTMMMGHKSRCDRSIFQAGKLIKQQLLEYKQYKLLRAPSRNTLTFGDDKWLADGRRSQEEILLQF